MVKVRWISHCVILPFLFVFSESLHLSGTFSPDTFFIFLSKFGFQKTETWNRNHTQGYIYGNITDPFDQGLHPFIPTFPTVAPLKTNASKAVTSSPVSTSTKSSFEASAAALLASAHKNSSLTSNTSSTVATKTSTKATSTTTSTTTTRTTAKPKDVPKVYPVTLVVVDRSYFLDFYKLRNSDKSNRNTACQLMFEEISHGNGCSSEAKVDFKRFLRRLPCSRNGICSDETNLTSIVRESQFTFPIENKNEAKFWYVSLVACYFDEESCKWKHSSSYSALQYDLWLVNGNPYMKGENPLENQFSFDRQDTVEIYLVFFLCYLILFPLQVHAVLRQRHIVPRLFTGSVTLELCAVLANVIDVLTYSIDGEGYPKLAVFGDILDILARANFMLILLVLAKGWAITRTELTSKPLIFTIWAVYGIINILLYVWNQTEVDVIEDIDVYQTWPGWLILILRTVIMMWFVFELKDTMDHEHQPHKLNFFLHFGAAALVWFIYLPIVALIALKVSPLWRSKLLLGITYSADYFAFAVMTHLLWPTRSQQYFLLTSNLDTSVTDELEEFNEAPHVVNSYARRSNNRVPTNYAIRDVSSAEAMSLTEENEHSLNNNTSINSYIDDKDSIPLIIT